MKKALVLLVLLLAPAFGAAQNTTVSATMVDSDGTTWASSSWAIDFRPGPNNPNESAYRLINGQSLSASVLHQRTTADATGHFSFVVYDSSLIVPGGSGWTLTACSLTSASCSTFQFTTAGGSTDLSTRLRAALPAPRFPPNNGAYGYADVEVLVSVNQGSNYWNVNSQNMHFWNGTVWVTVSTGGTPPGGANGDLQINNNGVFGPATGVTYSSPGSLSLTNNLTAGGSISAQTLGGSCYSKAWQTGPGNNGIDNAMAGGCSTIVSDPSYASTEQPTIASFPTTPFNHIDQRNSFTTLYYRNPTTDSTGYPAYRNRFGVPGNYGLGLNCQYDKDFTGGAADVRLYCFSILHNELNPGVDQYLPVGPAAWQVGVPITIQSNIYARGTHEDIFINHNGDSVGDQIGMYCYLWSSGGQVTGNTEGTKCLSWGDFEKALTFGGTITSSTTAPNPVHFVINAITGPGAQGVGRYAILLGTCPTYPTNCTLPTAPNSGLVTNIAAGLDGNTSAVTVNQTLPVSTVWGRLPAAGVPTPINPVGPTTPTPMTFNVTIVGGSAGAFNTTGLVCSDSLHHECSRPTAVGTVVGGVQSITIPWRQAHGGNSMIYQGGMAGNCLLFTAWVFTANQPGGQPLRYCYDVFGSTSSNVLQAGRFGYGAAYPVDLGSNIYTTTNLLQNLSSSGTIVTGTIVNTASINNNSNNISIMIANSDGGAIDGQCNNLTWVNTATFTCTNPNLSGTHTNATNVPTLQGMNTQCLGCSTASAKLLNAFAIYPMAEVIDTRNNNVNPPVIDGSVMVEPNIFGTPANGSYFEITHHPTGQYQAHTEYVNAYNWNTAGYNSLWGGSVVGQGFSGGSLSLASTALLRPRNDNPDSIYDFAGGALHPPNFLSFPGAYNIFFNLNHLPTTEGPYSGGIFVINPPAAQYNDPNLVSDIFYTLNRGYYTGQGFSGVSKWSVAPYTGNMNFYTNGVTTYTAAAHNFIGPTNMSDATFSTLGGLVSGAGINYAPYSNDLSQNQYWRVTGGTATVACGIVDNFQNPACSITAPTGNGILTDVPVSGTWTPIPMGVPVSIQASIRDENGGAIFTIGIGVQSSQHITPADTLWHNYCQNFTNTNPTYQNWFATIGQYGTASQKIDVANVVVRPGTACGPPVLTTNNQVITPVPINHAGTLSLGNLIGTGQRCLHTDANGNIGPATADCGTGAGGGTTIDQRVMAAVSACVLPTGGAGSAQCTGTITINGSGYADANYAVSATPFNSAGATLVFNTTAKTATTISYLLNCVQSCSSYGTYFLDVITSHP